MREYLDMKDSNIEWIGQIPKHWNINKIKFCSYVKGRVGWQGLRSEEFTDSGPYLITGTDFENGKINWNKCYHVEKWRYEQDPYIQIRNNDLLITKDGTIGKVALVEDMPDNATLNSGIMVIRSQQNSYLHKFMFWILNSYIFNQYIEYSKRGSTIHHLYQETFENFIFASPRNLKEQQDIIVFI
jgi:type I restriction enzyme S subunit